MVVLSTLVINTIIEKGPLIFLAIGEKSQGEIDAIIAPANAVISDGNSFFPGYS